MKTISQLFLLIGIPSLSAFSQNLSFSGGNAHSVMLCNNGVVYTMGANGNGQLGTNGAPASSNVPVKVLRGVQPIAESDGIYLSSIRQVDAGSGAHNLALSCNGNVYTWGWNNNGQLGDNTTTDRSTPVKVLTGEQGDPSGFLSNVVLVSAGNVNSYAVLSTGELVSWGFNDNGQLGNGNTTNSYTPVYVKINASTRLTDVIQIDGGDDFGVALKSDGTVWTWGFNSNGQLGQNNTTNYSYATQVYKDAARTQPLDNIVKVTAGDTHVMALDANGMLWVWGGVWSGQLAVPGGASRTLPTYALVSATGPELTGVKAISAGNQHSMAVMNDGTVMTWGGTNNYQGQTGTGSGSGYPVVVPGLTDMAEVSDGDLWSFAADADGNVYAWGWNGTGCLGVNSSNTTESSPIAVTLPCSLTKSCPEVNLGADITLCNPPSATLYAAASAPSTVKFRWKKDGALLPDTTSSLFINSAGTYRAVVWDSSFMNSCGYCVPDSDEVVVTNLAPVTANNAYFCPNPCGTAAISVTGSAGSNYDWYDSEYNGSKLNTTPSNSFSTPCITTTTTYWVEDLSTQKCTAGYAYGAAGLTGEGANWATGTMNKMDFNVLTSFTLDSVSIKFTKISYGVCSGVPSASGVLNIVIKNSGGTVLATINPILPCGAGDEVVTVPIGYTFPIGNGYRMEMLNAETGSVFSFTGGASYPKTDCSLITFTGSPNADADDTGPFFNWKLRVGSNTCGRTPVQAIANCELPVTYSEFTAYASGGNVYLDWSTSSEDKNSHFTIQRSSNGINFESIGKVDGAGTTNFTNSYQFTDTNPFSGISYYRIQQYDYDGNTTFSEIKTVSVKESDISLYPNPFSDKIHIVVHAETETAQLVIMDISGRVLSREEIRTDTEYSIGEELPAGMYLIKTLAGTDVKVFKAEKLK